MEQNQAKIPVDFEARFEKVVFVRRLVVKISF